jgi:hypothetical protein
MRSADARFDERQAGFRGLLDLLHQAQREGWLRLHRDRKGIWRIFSTSTEAIPSPVVPEAVPEAFPETFPESFPEPVVAPDTEIAPPETDVLWEAVESPEEPTVPEAPPAAPLPSEPPAEPVQAAPEKRARKVHPAKRSPRKTQRKATSRRKPKETTDGD